MQTVIGLFDNAQEAQQAAQQLMSEGFTSNNIDVSVRNEDNGISGSNSSDESYSTGALRDDLTTGNTNAGNIPGYTSGSDYTRENIDGTPTNGNFNTGLSDRTNTTNNDSFGDKVSKFFKNLFGDDDDDKAGRYSQVANKTGCVVTVHAKSKDEAEKAADVLDNNGAIDVDKNAAEYGYAGYNTFSEANSGDTDTLNVIREDVEIGKSEVETGGVRLRSRIIERPVEEELRLREEKIVVERKPVDRPATTADFQNFKEGEIEMTEYAEVAEVKKRARVVEEVSISKEVNERRETVNETARDTEVEVENLSKKKDNP